MTNCFVRLGEIDGDLGRRYRIARISDHGRPLQQGRDGGGSRCPSRAILGETVLRDLHRGAGLLHLLAQGLHLGDGEAGIVSHHDDVRGFEDSAQFG